MKRTPARITFLTASMLLLSSCGGGLLFQVATTSLELVVAATTGKTIKDHLISQALNRDCSIMYVFKDIAYCLPPYVDGLDVYDELMHDAVAVPKDNWMDWSPDG